MVMTHPVPASASGYSLENINCQLAFQIAFVEAEEQVAGRARRHRRLDANCEPTPRTPVAAARLIKSPRVDRLADVGLRCSSPAARSPAAAAASRSPSSSQI